MPRINIRFRDEEGNIMRFYTHEVPGMIGIVARLICAGISFIFIGSSDYVVE